MNIFGFHFCQQELAMLVAGLSIFRDLNPVHHIRSYVKKIRTQFWLARQPKLVCGPYRSES